MRPNARENGQIRPSTKRSGYPVLQEGRENANIDAGLGFIWRISVNTGSNHYVSACPEQRTVEKELEFYRKCVEYVPVQPGED